MKKVAGVLLFVVAYAGYRFAGMHFGTSIGRSEAQRDVVAEAKTLRTPTGFLDTEWLMSQNRVRAIRPNTTAVDANNLAEFTEWLGRPVYVVYEFTDDLFLLATITFTGESNQQEFTRVQQHLSEQFDGVMTPTQAPGYLLRSKSKVGRFAVIHSLALFNEKQVEQVQFYRTK